eukprot:m.335602 g.335602  ORF g.335602 m.335602 type:complete len:338 (+) comp17637_c0_seq1:231-1244(+)
MENPGEAGAIVQAKTNAAASALQSVAGSKELADDGQTKYIKTEVLGEGAYGKVFKAVLRDDDNVVVALKDVKIEQESEGVPATTLREISILKELDHDNIVRFVEVIFYQAGQKQKLQLVFEYLTNDLNNVIKQKNKTKENFTPARIKSLSYQLLRGIEFCHSRRILHRDLKPANLLLHGVDNAYLKVADFGLARSFGMPVRNYTHEVVTLWYRAPEILLGSDLYSCPVDIWSVGPILAEMASLRALFPADSEIHELYQIFHILGTPSEDHWPGVTRLKFFNMEFPKWKAQPLSKILPALEPEGIDLLQATMHYAPAERISARAALRHPYFRDVVMGS